VSKETHTCALPPTPCTPASSTTSAMIAFITWSSASGSLRRADTTKKNEKNLKSECHSIFTLYSHNREYCWESPLTESRRRKKNCPKFGRNRLFQKLAQKKRQATLQLGIWPGIRAIFDKSENYSYSPPWADWRWDQKKTPKKKTPKNLKSECPSIVLLRICCRWDGEGVRGAWQPANPRTLCFWHFSTYHSITILL